MHRKKAKAFRREPRLRRELLRIRRGAFPAGAAAEPSRAVCPAGADSCVAERDRTCRGCACQGAGNCAAKRFRASSNGTDPHGSQRCRWRGGCTRRGTASRSKLQILDASGESADAAECYAKARTVSPRLAVAWKKEALVLKKLGNAAGAKAAATAYLELVPTDEEFKGKDF